MCNFFLLRQLRLSRHHPWFRAPTCMTPPHSSAVPGAQFGLQWDSHRFLRFMKVGAVSVVFRGPLILMCPMLSVDVRLHHEVARSTGA
jgi:hypothetical protein